MADPTQHIELGVYGIIVSRTDDGHGAIHSDLRGPDDDPQVHAAIDTLEGVILAHACSGVDIRSLAYLEGIETAVDAIANHAEGPASSVDPVGRWQCDKCGQTVEVGYQGLAEVGTPICSDCDADMVLLPLVPPPVHESDSQRRYILYDFDAGDLATTTVYEGYTEAADDASALDNVIVMPLVFETASAATVEPPAAQSGTYHLTIDGPTFRRQRELLSKLRGLANDQVPYSPAADDCGLLDGLIELTDELADQSGVYEESGRSTTQRRGDLSID